MADLAKEVDSSRPNGERIVVPVAIEIDHTCAETSLHREQLADEKFADLQLLASNDNGNGDDDGGNSPSAVLRHEVIIDGKKYHISHKSLQSNAEYIAEHMNKFYSIAANARAERALKGAPISSVVVERGDMTYIYYDTYEMKQAIHRYVLGHPEEIIKLGQTLRRNAKVRKILGFSRYAQLTALDFERAEAVKKFIKINRPKSYCVNGNTLCFTDVNGNNVSVNLDSMLVPQNIKDKAT